MSRPKAFDPNDALDRATDLFRRKGYAATSIGDLVAHTGLSRSSLYDTFGDKHALYLAALDRYRARGHSGLSVMLGRYDSALEGIRAYFETVAQDCACPTQGRYGCFAVNAAAECAATDAETAARTAANWQMLTNVFAATLRRAQQQGELAANRDAEALGHFLTNAVYGLRGLQTAGASADAIRSVIETTLTVLKG
jgi:TetR/AcrR family transcriptional repressor of nem operon